MADSLCGPSNALQSFQKHTSVDRTLQQDRLSSRHSPSQAFRSQNSSAGTLDPEFDAFEAGAAPPPPDFQHPQLFNQGPHHAPQFPHVEGPGWASDFQKLQLSDPVHSAPHSQFEAGVPRHNAPQGWQNEFMQQQRARPAQLQMSQAQPLQRNYNNHLISMNSAMTHGMPALSGAPQTQSQQAEHPQEAFDESAFEAAFDQARAEIEMQEQGTSQEEDLTNGTTEQEEPKIGSDTIPHTEITNATDTKDNSDELARTAGQLLDSVSHDQSQKFKDSNFLALMRKIRDREVRVEGDEFREAQQPLHPGGQFYPEG